MTFNLILILLCLLACFLFFKKKIKLASSLIVFCIFSWLFISFLGSGLILAMSGQFEFFSPIEIAKLFDNSIGQARQVLYLVCFASFLTSFLTTFLLMNKKKKKELGNACFASIKDVLNRGLFGKSNYNLILARFFGKPISVGGDESMLICSAMGGGKTTAIAVPNLLNWGGSAIVNDLKGELWDLTSNFRRNRGSECYVFAPGEEHKDGASFNPFFYISQEPKFRLRDLQRISEVLIPFDEKGPSFWVQSARSILVALCLYCLENKKELTLGHIYDLSKKDDLISFLIEISALGSVEIKQCLSSVLSADEKSQANILSDYINRLNLFGDPIIRAYTSKNTFDLSKMRGHNISVYIKINPVDQERLRPLLTLIWSQFLTEMTRSEPNRQDLKVLALMDEFGNLAKLPMLKSGMSYLRSYKVRAIIIVQYLDQIKSVYGQNDCHAFLNCKTKVCFSLSSYVDAEFFSKLIGNLTVSVKNRSNSMGKVSISQNKQSRPLMSPDEILRMPKDKCLILIEGENPVMGKKNFYFINK